MVVEDKIVPHTPNYRNNHEENCAMFHTKIFVPSETIRTLKRHVSTKKEAVLNAFGSTCTTRTNIIVTDLSMMQHRVHGNRTMNQLPDKKLNISREMKLPNPLPIDMLLQRSRL
jgi:hypothetical protein